MKPLLPLLVLSMLPPAFFAQPDSLKQEPNTWVKRSPLKDGPVSPGMGYETSLGWDPRAKQLIRWGGHNQGGGGEQNAETWAFDPLTAKWTLKEPNTSPVGVCCAQQNVFDPDGGRFIRFPAFSGSHGWHWFRENYLSNTSAWSYDLATNTWRDLRPAPAPRIAPLRCASWDSDHGVVVIFGGENSNEGTLVYDPWTNTWTRMNPKTQPKGRSGGNMTYDAANKVHVLFGSQFGDDPETWTYDLRRNEWTDRKPKNAPPGNRNDAVLAYDPNGKVTIALVRVVDQQEGMEVKRAHVETWAYDVAKNDWKQMKPAREPDGWGNRRRVMVAVPEYNVILSEHYINPTERVPDAEREQQIWTYRYAESKPVLMPPRSLSLKAEAKSVVLTWEASPSKGVKSYLVYRGEGPHPWKPDMKSIGAVASGRALTLKDDRVKPGRIAHYHVRAVDENDRESEPSALVRTQPRVVEDGVVSVIGAKEVRLTWKPAAKDVTAYHVERAVVEMFSEDEIKRLKTDTPPLATPSAGTIKAIGAFRRLTTKPLQEVSYTDTDIDLKKPQTVEGEPIFTHRFPADRIDKDGKPYPFSVFAYRVRAINALGVESGPSPYWLTIPSAPQYVFAKESGEDALLKWAKNPEDGIKGYRVYRMESPKINGPGQKVTRLNGEPVAGTNYHDARIGKETRRYWVVAVDALGQEGIPSAPVWHYRQYQKYYLPFTGEWHQ